MKQEEKVRTIKEFAADGFPGSLSYAEYRKLVKDRLAEGRSTSSGASEYPIEIIRLNDHRMDRWDKHFQLRSDILAELERIRGHYTWLTLTEGWCGDSAQSLPQIARIAASSAFIDMRLMLRDETLWLMDQYLTNGTRSIPLVICLDDAGNEVFRWGARPAAIQEEFIRLKKSDDPAITSDKVKEMIHLRYAQDKGNALQDDFLLLLRKMK
jgi:hypothetical protein